MAKEKITITEGQVKKDFTTIGLIYIVYLLITLFINNIIGEYLLTLPIGHIDEVNYQYIVVGVKYIIILCGSVIPFLILANHNKVKMRDIFRAPNIKLSDILSRTIVLIIIAELVIFVITLINNYLPIEGELLYPIGLNKTENGFNNYLYIVLFVLGTPIVEEFVFRGVLLKILDQYGLYFGMITSSILFALATESIGEFILAFAVGIFLAETTIRFRSIVPAIFMHIMYNAYFAIIFTLTNTRNGIYIPYIILGVIALFVIIMLTKRFERFVIKKDTQFGYVTKLFFTRISVIIGIILAVIFPIVRTIMMIVEKSSI